MAEVTVKQLAAAVGSPVERLLQQMQDAGLPHKSGDETVNDEQKVVLLTALEKVTVKKLQRVLKRLPSSVKRPQL